jgi:DNA gyrase/topoisomerase IV subunit B
VRVLVDSHLKPHTILICTGMFVCVVVQVSGGLHGVGISVVNALSESVKVGVMHQIYTLYAHQVSCILQS